ncbi:hypothetical protein [Gordonia rhizosphera]|uniref:hypothetical protein n=1 Tax=Gordonia rhizosphera TaxID=83341 RepID=UPI0012F6DDD9|nr:hypothetical protein [Gordonia rhizosphera]
MSFDPFAGLQDQQAPSPTEAVAELLADSKRGYVPIRDVLVQREDDAPSRSAKLAEFVTSRQERALDALLLLYALQPIHLTEEPLPLGAWANLLSTRTPCSTSTVSRTFRVLEEMRLVTRSRSGPKTVIAPLHESADGSEWFRPGSNAAVKEGFFTLPHEFWTAGYSDRLHLPGKTMLLIILKETQSKQRPTFSMAVERAQRWYGISERTAERGYGELGAAGLLDVQVQRKGSARLPAGVLRPIYHRALRDPFSTSHRAELQRTAKSHGQKRVASPGGDR